MFNLYLLDLVGRWWLCFSLGSSFLFIDDSVVNIESRISNLDFRIRIIREFNSLFDIRVYKSLKEINIVSISYEGRGKSPDIVFNVLISNTDSQDAPQSKHTIV